MKLERTRKFYEVEYEQKKRSPQDIAKQFDTYPNKIRRELLTYGFHLRNKSEAQSVAIKQGRHSHPTRGKKRDENVKIKISESMAKKWQVMTEEEKTRRVTLGKSQWEAMSDQEKMSLQEAALEAVRDASQEGSKLEKFLLNSLREKGFEVSFHSEHILPGTRLQTDLYIPTHNVVIEVDGPSHFYPIWGQESLDKNIEADAKKNSMLLTYGFVIVRVKHLAKTISEIHKRKLLVEVLNVLENVGVSFPAIVDRLIEVELK